MPGRAGTRVLAALVLVFLLGLGFAASIDLGFSADGAYLFARILDDRSFMHPSWFRVHGDVMLQWPLVLAVQAGVTNFPVLKGLFHIGLFFPVLLSLALCWWAKRPERADPLLLFPFASLLLVSFPSASILVGVHQVLAVIVWPILFLLLRPERSRLDSALLLGLLVAMTRLYETAVVSGLILLGVVAQRMKRESRLEPVLLGAVGLLLVTIALGTVGTLDTASPANRASFISGITRSLADHPTLAVAAGSLVLLGLSLVRVNFEWLAIPALALAGGSLGLPLAGRTASAGASFDLRSLTLTVLPLLLLAAIWWNARRPALSRRQWILAGLVLGLLAAGYGTSWTAWRGFRRDFKAEVSGPAGYVPVDSTSVAHNPQRWRWTTSLLSILWSPDCVRTIILNRPGPLWEPFDPRVELPLQRYVRYAEPLGAASPAAPRCR